MKLDSPLYTRQKQQLKQWIEAGVRAPKKLKIVPTAGKVRALAFFGIRKEFY